MRTNPWNPVWIHPDDLRALGGVDGDWIEIESEHGSITAVVEADASMRRGVIAVTHAWGGLPDDDVGAATPTARASNPARLIPTDAGVETINRMPTMTALAVRVRKIDNAAR
jgi:anaerobic selenocysteine-containing dehydrogenase